ncbi:hypothetical protein PN498_04080 [Oscillatoria sp. CS-180]|uniref:hypothetical protein n=1 Tax=Oscillatoria sp. CS-180 TaxID=3021720 RepID=UPI002330F02B|nr:hypothetical protein [Oscillatoria sp. CS-180]MDB9525153.1 hypothetical protein [Oscillatoria sp. CS-180]
MPIFWSLHQTNATASSAIAPASEDRVASGFSSNTSNTPSHVNALDSGERTEEHLVQVTTIAVEPTVIESSAKGIEPISDVSERPNDAVWVEESAIAATSQFPENLTDRAAKPNTDKKEPKSATPLLETFLESFPEDNPPRATSPSPDDAVTSAPDESALPADIASVPADPELGVIEVEDPRRDPELGIIQLRSPLQDPELGILQLRQIAPPPPPRPSIFLSTYVSASSSDNVFLVEDAIQGRFGDNFIRPGIRLTAFPQIGPSTNIVASVETNFLRYQEQSNSSYDEIRFRAGIRHRFSDRVYGQLTFSHQMLFDEGYQDQFFSNDGIELTIGRRDFLTPQLTLDTYYQGQVFFSDPERFSNVLNSVGAYLGYRIDPRWDTGLSYRLTVSDFTQQNRHETYQRITGQIRYAISPSVRVSLFGGLSYGRSSEERITFDDSFFGISFDATIPLF